MLEWTPRPYQNKLLIALNGAGYRRACLVWHRRCLVSDTQVRMWDGTTKAIRDLREGDEIFGHGGIHKRYEKAIVKSVWQSGTKPVRRYYFTAHDNTKAQIVCTDDHRIAVYSCNKSVIWREASWFSVLRESRVPGYDPVRFKKDYYKSYRSLGCDSHVTYEETWDIETTTGSFFANDILVHNSGKDFTCWMHIVDQAIKTPGVYYYVLPTYRQGKKAIWDAIANDGKKFLDYIPKHFIEGNPNQTEMKIRFSTGSILQVVGGDDPDSLRGTNPRGVILSEYSRMNPGIWDNILRPILAANHGWVVFNSTPNGRNHFKDLYDMAHAHPEAWYTSRLTVDDTHVVSQDVIEQDMREGMSEDMALQEYMCSFNAGTEGAYYAKLMEQARNESRIGHVPYDRSVPVYTSWDLGFGDSTAIIFFQLVGSEVRVIDYYEASGEGMEHYASTLDDRPYRYAKHYAPHDVEAGSLQSGVSLKQVAKGLGIDFVTLPRAAFSYGIEQARITLPFCYFDEVKCKRLIKCLDGYQKKYNRSMEMYLDEPLHNQLSHGADSYRYLACARAQIKNSTNIDPQDFNQRRMAALYGQEHNLPGVFQQPYPGMR